MPIQINDRFTTNDLAEGLKLVGINYAERECFSVEDYQMMVIVYLLSSFLPHHTVGLHFDRPTQGRVMINHVEIEFTPTRVSINDLREEANKADE